MPDPEASQLCQFVAQHRASVERRASATRDASTATSLLTCLHQGGGLGRALWGASRSRTSAPRLSHYIACSCTHALSFDFGRPRLSIVPEDGKGPT